MSSAHDKIATVDPATLKITEYSLPNDRSRGRRIAITSDDRIWYVDYSRGYLGRFDPAEQAVQGVGAAGRNKRSALRHVDGRSRPALDGRDRLAAEPAGGIRPQDREVLRDHPSPERRRDGAAHDVRQAHRADLVRDATTTRSGARGDGGRDATGILAFCHPEPFSEGSGRLRKDPSTRTRRHPSLGSG